MPPWPRVLAAALWLAPVAGAAAAAPSCHDAVGARLARRYVAHCLEVSPATHPPCNAANPCELILDEIRRGCALLDAAAPPFCRDVPPPP